MTISFFFIVQSPLDPVEDHRLNRAPFGAVLCNSAEPRSTVKQFNLQMLLAINQGS